MFLVVERRLIGCNTPARVAPRVARLGHQNTIKKFHHSGGGLKMGPEESCTGSPTVQFQVRFPLSLSILTAAPSVTLCPAATDLAALTEPTEFWGLAGCRRQSNLQGSHHECPVDIPNARLYQPKPPASFHFL